MGGRMMMSDLLLRLVLPVSRALKCAWPLVRFSTLPVLVTRNRLLMDLLVFNFPIVILLSFSNYHGNHIALFFRFLVKTGRHDGIHVFNKFFNDFKGKRGLLVFSAS